MRALLLILCIPTFVYAKGLEGTQWKVRSHKIVGDDPSWTNEEAEGVTGKAVSFRNGQFKMGKVSCKMKITPQQDARNWTAGEKDPCDGEDLRGRVYSLTLDNCEARFPGTVALTDKHAVAFGAGVSFCLEKK